MDLKQNIEQFKGQPRLPKFAIPKRYDLYLKLDLSACTFSGLVHVDLSIVEPTKFIVLNACELVVRQVFFTNSLNHRFTPCDVVLDSDDEILVLFFDEVLGTGEGVLRIEFSGALNEHLKGLYKCTYVDKGVRKNMAVTQFEAVHARRCFPCWDEPALKATFRITLDLPSELMALSNMPIIDEKFDGNVKTIYFEESPIMSSYLVAVAVGLFDHIEETTADGIKVGVYCPVGKSDEGKFSLEVAVKSLDIFTRKLFLLQVSSVWLVVVCCGNVSSSIISVLDWLLTVMEIYLSLGTSRCLIHSLSWIWLLSLNFLVELWRIMV